MEDLFDTIYCIHCKAQIAANSVICPHCRGEQRRGTPASQPATTPVRPPRAALQPGLCNRIVCALDDWWGFLGWGLFIAWLVMPWIAMRAGYSACAWICLGLLAILWWAIDIVDQQTPVWMVLVGVLMLAIAYITPLGFARLIFTVAPWVIYWTRVRE